MSSKIEFEGKGITPESFTLPEISKIITLIEQIVKPIAKRESKKELFITLKSLEKGCMALTLSSNLEPTFIKVCKIIADAFKNNSLVKLPYLAIGRLEELHRIMKLKKADMNLFSLKNGEKLLGSISSKEFSFDSANSLRGKTTIFGKVMKTGGKNPTAIIELSPGYSFFCEGTVEQIKKLANNLYSTVSLAGEAFYDSESFEIEFFKIEEIIPWNPKPIHEVVKEIKNEFGDYYNNIDMKEFRKEMRH